MEVQHVLAVIYVIVGVYSAGIPCPAQATFSAEKGRCSSKSQSNSLESDAKDCIHSYIAEGYFRKHDILLDAHFQDFILHELPEDSCNGQQMPKHSVLHRQLTGEGSHRRLLSSITFENQPDWISQLPVQFCKAIIIERLPSGVFADPFELQRLVQRGVFADAGVFGDTNLELPSFQSNRSVVEVHKDIGPDLFSENNRKLEINIELPLHARYPPPGEHGFFRVEFGTPDLFLRCSMEVEAQIRSCLFPSSNNSKFKDVSTVWDIPSGIKEDQKIVSVVTFVSAIASALLIVLACIFLKDTAGLKQS